MNCYNLFDLDTLSYDFAICWPKRIKFLTKGRFTRYDFVACDKLTTGLRRKLFRVNQTYNSLTTVVYATKYVLKSYDNGRYRQC